MDSRPSPSLAESLAAAQEWWREAGVDLAFRDEPQAWLAPLSPSEPSGDAAVELQPAPPAIGGDPAGWPCELSEFAVWWLEEPSLDDGPSRNRVAPRGRHEAQLMIVVPMPEEADRETLLSGPQGRLLANMVRAMSLPPEQVYLASALPRCAPLQNWSRLAAEGMGAVLRHPLGLVSPKQLLVLGNDILPLLGHDWAQGAPAVSEISIQSRSIPVMTSYGPGRLLDHPRLRSDLWRRWLEWTGSPE
jgi:DNA polymerase